MKKNIDFLIIVVLLFIMIGMGGCTMKKSDVQKNTELEVVLTQRQKDILAEQGLPTEYTELSASQQRAIIAIEDMLDYAEKKYNTSFSYFGYSAISPLENEHMHAFPTSGDIETDSFTITKTKNGYTDDYMNVAANALFVSFISDEINKMLPNINVNVFAKITKTTLDEVPTADTDFQGKIESSMFVFIDSAVFTEQDLNCFKEEFKDYLTEQKLYGIVQLILLKNDKILYITKYNYTAYLSKEHYTAREVLYINR